jgi:hypothetical protein
MHHATARKLKLEVRHTNATCTKSGSVHNRSSQHQLAANNQAPTEKFIGWGDINLKVHTKLKHASDEATLTNAQMNKCTNAQMHKCKN